jgi:ElaB/YqjD/DUF883 family membrane-anchored ribosome-binding protein
MSMETLPATAVVPVTNIVHPAQDNSPTGMERMEAATQGLTAEVQGAFTMASDTMTAVKESMGETIDTMKDATRDGVASVKSALDVRQHPWLWLGGAVAVGYLVGHLASRSGS